jgi:hypothetical protein
MLYPAAPQGTMNRPQGTIAFQDSHLKMGELRSHNLLHLLHRLLALLQTGTMSCEMSEERNA